MYGLSPDFVRFRRIDGGRRETQDDAPGLHRRAARSELEPLASASASRKKAWPPACPFCTIGLVRVHLITAESVQSRRLRRGRLIQFPQLTMPLIAALTPPEHLVSHTDEIVEPVPFDVPADLVGITAPTPSALHAYRVAREFRRRGVPVVIGGPHATALPEEAARHADAVVVGEAEDTWPRVLADTRRGRLAPI